MLIEGDSLEVLRTLPDASVDALVCDPPAGIGFMGKAWDGNKGGRDQWIAWLASILREAHRVLKPGAHGLVWALPRTSHWTGMACEHAGFEVRDRIAHLFGTGFPKSMDASKAIDAQVLHGGSDSRRIKEAIGDRPDHRATATLPNNGVMNGDRRGGTTSDTPATDVARQWQGWGTALKPACEDWWLIRKPLSGTVAENVLRHGTGAINVDGCRVGTDVLPAITAGQAKIGTFERGLMVRPERIGRWPANVTHDGSDEVVGLFPIPHGAGSSRFDQRDTTGEAKGMFPAHGSGGHRFGDSGSAARFFYCAKASRSDRGEDNAHPTAKSTALMCYLCRLITPPGGTVLDCFMGSGSTGVAAIQEGFKFIGIEKEPEYFEIARKRMEAL